MNYQMKQSQLIISNEQESIVIFIQEHKELPNMSSCTYFASQTNLAVIKTSHDVFAQVPPPATVYNHFVVDANNGCGRLSLFLRESFRLYFIRLFFSFRKSKNNFLKERVQYMETRKQCEQWRAQVTNIMFKNWRFTHFSPMLHFIQKLVIQCVHI